uniref:Uncharacterized protein n=1 Tax=Amphilophus citrinellus TaxID=61819 RepID=A0A3Q0S8D9_AMPCI
MVDKVGAAAGIASVAVGLSPAISETLTHRQCTIEIINQSNIYSLCDPSIMYIEHGMCTIPPSPFIGSLKTDSIHFIKTPNAAYGSVAVFTYKLKQSSSPLENSPKEKLALMFSVPFSFAEYSNYYAVGIFPESQNCDRALYLKMYYETEDQFKRKKANELIEPFIIHEGSDVIIRAAMSDAYQPIIKLHVADK